MVGTIVKSDLSVDTKNACPSLDVSLLLELYFTETLMLTVEVNFIRPNNGILIPPGEENEYLVVSAIVLRPELDSDWSVPSPVLYFFELSVLYEYELDSDKERHSLKFIDNRGL